MKMTVVCFLVPVLAWGQWFEYPAPGVPRGKDGKVNLAAAAPVTLDGYPDFSGVWGTQFEKQGCQSPVGCIEQMQLPQIARNIGFYIKDGLPYQPATARLMEQRIKDASKDDPHVRCTPPLFPRGWALPQYKRIVQQPGVMAILHEFQATYRQIHLDGRPLLKEPNPTWNGYSTAHWEDAAGRAVKPMAKRGPGAKATLVVETYGFRDDSWLDMRGNTLSSAARVTERIRRPNWGTLEVEVTVDDPKLYTKPWTLRMDQWLIPDTDIIDEICVENEKDREHLVGNAGK
jgi:hypothetical protein